MSGVWRRRSLMARRAARELLNLVLRDEPRSKFVLIRRRDVVGRKHELAGSDEVLRGPVALEAPLHLKRVFLPDERHAIDRTVARRAAHALAHMDAVVEVH